MTDRCVAIDGALVRIGGSFDTAGAVDMVTMRVGLAAAKGSSEDRAEQVGRMDCHNRRCDYDEPHKHGVACGLGMKSLAAATASADMSALAELREDAWRSGLTEAEQAVADPVLEVKFKRLRTRRFLVDAPDLVERSRIWTGSRACPQSSIHPFIGTNLGAPRSHANVTFDTFRRVMRAEREVKVAPAGCRTHGTS